MKLRSSSHCISESDVLNTPANQTNSKRNKSVLCGRRSGGMKDGGPLLVLNKNTLKYNCEVKCCSNPVLRNRGRPRKCEAETRPRFVSNCGSEMEECAVVRKRGRPRKEQWDNKGIENGFVKRRGRPKGNMTMIKTQLYVQNCKYQFCANKGNGEMGDLNQISEYEMLHTRRREEMLSMLRDLFSVESSPSSTPNYSYIRPRKYCKRPLPPMRARSLRLQGFSPGQRPLRRRRTPLLTPPRCFCCCWEVPTSHT